MDPLSAAVLGLVQALTEFLPVSSSGHLVLGQALLGVDAGSGAAFEVAVHLGTLLSVLLLLRREVGVLLRALVRLLKAPTQVRRLVREDADIRLGVAIVVGCLPAGILGVLFKDQLEAAFSSVRLVACALLFTGVLLLSTRFLKPGTGEVTVKRGLLIGLAQAVAILPGVSRSGSTISTAMLLKVEPEAAARYSFLMSLPVIGGASALKAMEMLKNPPDSQTLVALGIGGAVAFVAGLGTLRLVFAVVRRGWFSHFGWYCLALGTVALIFAGR